MAGITPEECERKQDRIFTKLDDMQKALAGQHVETISRITACETKIDDYMQKRDESGEREANAVRRIGTLEQKQARSEAKMASSSSVIGHVITFFLAIMAIVGAKLFSK